MKFPKIFLFFLLMAAGIGSTNAYLFGFKSSDNTIENIQNIESTYDIKTPIVSFIFDPREDWILELINKFPTTLGTNRIYHLTLSPNNFSAQEVASGAFDIQYTAFFKAIKKNNLKVIFRTMHEMNGGRYPRASNPEMFKKARIHIRDLSRKVGLSTGDILFDMSVNHRDMPTKGKPTQTAKLIPCQLQYKAKLNCPTFEDYYPGDKYVDLMGFTFYNRGKGNSDRKWLTPNEIVYEKGRNPLERVKKIGKPIIIDEVGTTAVWYTGDFKRKTSQEYYQTDYKTKNIRLWQLKQLLLSNEEIVAMLYFNVDYTEGLKRRLIGEADRSVINPNTNKVYNTIFSLLKDNEQLHKWSKVANLFGVGQLSINKIDKLVPIKYITPVKTMRDSINKSYTGEKEKIKAFNLLTGTYLKTMFPKTTQEDRNQIRGRAKSFLLITKNK